MTARRAGRGGTTGWRDREIALLLATATALAYGRIWTLGFVSYDDPGYVTDNPQVLAGLGWSGVVWAFTTTAEANWHPVTWLSLMVDATIAGADPRMFHGTNLVLHLVNTVLVFVLLRHATGAPWRSALVAGLFALHPLHVESVAWVSERKDVLSTAFWLLAAAAYCRWAAAPSAARYAALAVVFALGLMTKPMLVTLPLTLLLLDVWPLGRAARVPARTLVVEKLPLVALALASGVVTLLVQRPAMDALAAVPLPARIANALWSVVAYLGAMCWPFGLSPIYPYPRAIPLWQPLAATVLIVAASIAALRAWRTRPWLATGWLFYLVTLVPVLGLVQVGYQARADRYTYVPLLGPFVIVAWGTPELAAWLARRTRAGHQRGRAATRRRAARDDDAVPYAGALATLAGVVLAALAVRTWDQVGHWRSSLDLFTHAVRVTADNAHAHYNLSTAHQETGDVERAVVHLREALRLAPRMVDAHYNLARLLMKQGRLDEAAVLVAEQQAWWPANPHTLVDLGVLAVLQGRRDEAIARFTEALRLAPDLPDARYNLDALTRNAGDLPR